MNALVVGAGPVGKFVAQILQAQNLEVQTLVRGGTLKEVGANSSIWLCVKGYDVESVLQGIRNHLNPSHDLFLISNGLGIYDRAVSICPTLKFYRLLLNFGVSLDKQGRVSQHGEARVLLAGAAHLQLELSTWAEELGRYGFLVELCESVKHCEWRKLMVNLLVNTLATLANAPNKILIEDPGVHQRALHLLQEIRNVARAQGINLDSWSNDYIFQSIKDHGENFNSTLCDLRNGKRTELPFMLDAFIERAQIAGIESPLASALKQQLDLLMRGTPSLQDLV